MARAGDVLGIPSLGVRIVFRQTTADTEGALLEYDVIGRPHGFVVQRHVHPSQEERQEVLEGATGLSVGGAERVYGAGESYAIPPGTPHRHYPAGSGEGHVRVELRPALDSEALLERLAQYDREGQITSRGLLRPTAAARMISDFDREGRATSPPFGLQRAFAKAVLGAASLRESSTGAYVFVDEWDVRAPIAEVFEALADGRTYPLWWRPVYISVETDGPPGLGRESRQHFKGRLPYHLHTTSVTTRYEPPHVVAADVDGDLRGRAVWTLTDADAGAARVRFDWSVFADRPLLRTLTPALRPAFRWNHAWAIACAIEGLEPYARATVRPPQTDWPR